MIELLGTWLMAYDSGFDVLRYLTVRTIGGTLTALMFSIVLGPTLIKFLSNIQFSQSIRRDGPESHLAKSGTPTMGGLIIISSLIVSTLLWSDFKNPYIWILIFITISFSVIGFLDDWLKIKQENLMIFRLPSGKHRKTRGFPDAPTTKRKHRKTSDFPRAGFRKNRKTKGFPHVRAAK